MCKEVPPAVVMTFLNDLYTCFDRLGTLLGSYAGGNKCIRNVLRSNAGDCQPSWHAQPVHMFPL